MGAEDPSRALPAETLWQGLEQALEVGLRKRSHRLGGHVALGPGDQRELRRRLVIWCLDDRDEVVAAHRQVRVEQLSTKALDRLGRSFTPLGAVLERLGSLGRETKQADEVGMAAPSLSVWSVAKC